MKQNLSASDGRSLVSKVAYVGNLKESIEHSVSLIGGIEKLVKKGDTILLKPNYNTADPFPGSSDPEFVKNYRHALRGWSGKGHCRRENCFS